MAAWSLSDQEWDALARLRFGTTDVVVFRNGTIILMSMGRSETLGKLLKQRRTYLCELLAEEIGAVLLTGVVKQDIQTIAEWSRRLPVQERRQSRKVEMDQIFNRSAQRRLCFVVILPEVQLTSEFRPALRGGVIIVRRAAKGNGRCSIIAHP